MKERPILFSGAMVRALLEGRKTQTRRVLRHQPSEVHPMPERDSLLMSPRVVEQDGRAWAVFEYTMGEEEVFPCPYGQPGDRLWVRENFCRKMTDEGLVWNANGGQDPTCCWFQADGVEVLAMDDDGGLRFRANGQEASPWSPSIHMPRWACRLVLEIVSVRVERLQEISEEDAMAEGALFALDPEQTMLSPHLTEERNAGCAACGGDSNGIASLCHPALRGKGRPHACWFATLWDSINAKRDLGWEVNPWVWVVEFKRVGV